MPLTPKQKCFVEEYLIDLNQTQAAIRAGYSEKTANEQASRLLANVNIQAAIKEAMAERSKRTQITADMVLQRWWEISNVDVNDLVQFRRTCCRYCHGIDFEYQWTEKEFNRACRNAEEAAEKAREEKDDDRIQPEYPEATGGMGYNKTLDPNPECPECFGEGHGEMFAQDSRKLKGPARALFGGVKQTRDGLEIKMKSQDKALENVANHLGMFKNKGDEQTTDALSALADAINASRKK